MYQHIKVPAKGEKITCNADFSLDVPDQPIIPYIEGDGIGIDITPVMHKVIDTAVNKAYGGQRQIQWMEVYAGEKANQVYAEIATKAPEKRDWFDTLTLFFMEKIDERELLTSIDSKDAALRDAQLCEAYYFVGLKLQQQGQGDPSRYFRRALQAQAKQLSAYRAAQLALESMPQ